MPYDREETADSGGISPGQKGLTMADAVVLDKAVDQAYESTGLEELLDAPVALARVSDGDADHLAAAFGIRTVRDLGTSKYFAIAQALVALAAHGG
jgi:hypothetical protein